MKKIIVVTEEVLEREHEIAVPDEWTDEEIDDYVRESNLVPKVLAERDEGLGVEIYSDLPGEGGVVVLSTRVGKGGGVGVRDWDTWWHVGSDGKERLDA